MTKPQEFREQRIVSVDTKYQVSTGAQKGPSSGSGILTTGRVVWIQGGTPAGTNATVPAYAEGVGVVSISTECLK